eukprot:jgi/Tetstr1/437623/TSEL_026290.t1
MLQKSSDFTAWKHLFLSFINTYVREVTEQMILLDPNDPNIAPQLRSYLYHTLVQFAQHHRSATSELKNLSPQSTAVNRAVVDLPSDDTEAGDELTLEEKEMLLSGEGCA